MTTPEMSETLEALLEYVRRTRGFDFTGYKHPSLMRRTRKRMHMVGIQDVGEYLDYMEVHPEEFTHLFNTILINVTAFFRDSQAWDFLAREAITRILGDKREGEPIRVWSAGCASGEEAYSLAILLAEALGAEAFRERVKIYATDVDTEALGQGRHGSYSEKDLEPVSPERRSQFFERDGDRYLFRPDLRRSVIFGRHDLVQDAPISRQDLISCRNTLIYFNAETQGRVLARFHFALNDNGFLFLGRAETLLTHASLFMPLDLRHRVFSSVPKTLSRERVAVLNPGGAHPLGGPLSSQLRLRSVALETAPVGRIMLDRQGHLAVANERARAFLGLTTNDLGRSFRDLEAAFRLADLASRIEQAMSHRRSSSLTEVERRLPTGEVQFLEVQVVPLPDEDGVLIGVSVTLSDVTPYHRLAEEIRRGKEEQETVAAELQASNEELVTTNEELQSTVEELETTNEELQSANEEMETMNEELQSTNAQLLTANDELRQRDGELNTVNAFQRSILASMPVGVVVLDRRLTVLMWNLKAEDLWGLRAEEVQGKSLFELEIGLPVGPLGRPIQACLSGEQEHQELVLDAVNRRGKTIKCEIVCTRLMGPGPSVQGVILVMEEKRG